MVWVNYQASQSSDNMKSASFSKSPQEETSLEPPSETSLLDNPVNFEVERTENSDIYAWIYIPNTNINYPILQHAILDNYYLSHNVKGEKATEGAIYTQMANTLDFTDPVTVLYGHNLIDGTMFSTLHYFENPDFFKENEFIYIYTPGRILTYRVISAYMYDDRHILNSFDFSNPSITQDYFNYVTNPDSLLANVRAETELASGDTIIQLSTCFNEWIYSNNRYIVTGVLVDNQETN